MTHMSEDKNSHNFIVLRDFEAMNFISVSLLNQIGPRIERSERGG